MDIEEHDSAFNVLKNHKDALLASLTITAILLDQIPNMYITTSEHDTNRNYEYYYEL